MSDGKSKAGTGKSGWCIEAKYQPDGDAKHRACVFKGCTCECHEKKGVGPQ